MESPLLLSSIATILCAPLLSIQLSDSTPSGKYSIDEFDELAGVIVHAVHEDSLGFLWIGSHGSVWRGQRGGFERIDGPEGWGLYARCFLENPDGTMWVGTDKGLAAIDVRTLQPIVAPLPLSNRKVLSMFRDARGRTWAGTDAGLFEIVTHGVELHAEHIPDTGFDCFSIAPGLNDDLWLSTNTVVLRVDGTTVERHLEGTVGSGPLCMLRASDGALWIGSRKPGGLIHIKNGKSRSFDGSDGLHNLDVNALTEAPDGEVWVGTEEGIFRWDGASFDSIHAQHGLPNTDVHSLTFDREEQLWVGTFGSGAMKIRSPHVTTLGINDGLRHPMIMALSEDPQGDVVVATIGGFGRVGPNASRDENSPMAGHQVRCMCWTPDGQLWLGGQHGVWPEGQALIKTPSRPNTMVSDASGRVFVGTPNGLFVVYDGHVRSVELPESSGRTILSLQANPDGTIYVGAQRGLLHGAPGQFKLVVPRRVTAIHRTATGELWIGSRNRATRIAIPGLESGDDLTLTTGAVHDLLSDDRGRLWIATPAGLQRYDGVALATFGTADGLPSRGINCLQLHDEWMMVGTTHGLARVDVSRLEPCKAPPLIAITDWRVGHIPEDQPETSVNENLFGIRVEALGWRSAVDPRYQFLLEGRDLDWGPPTSDNLQLLGGLAPGDYVFKARVINASGTTSTSVASMALSVPRPLWREPAVIVMIIFCLAVASLWVVLQRQRRRRTRERQHDLETQLQHAQRMETVGTLAAGLAHEVNNLLTAILGYNDKIRQTAALPAQADSAAMGIETVAGQATTLTRSLLAFSHRGTTEKMPLDIGAMAREVAELLGTMLPNSIRVASAAPNGPVWINANAALVHQVFMNLALNSRDAMGDNGGRLHIDVRHELAQTAPLRASANGAAIVVVSDTGCGMTDAVRARIFDPFYTTKTRERGTGLGLSVVHGIVRDHDGHISVDSIIDHGTTITFAVPCCDAPSSFERENENVQPAVEPRSAATILLAEDNARIRSLISDYLEMAGYRVVPAIDGAAAMDAFESLDQAPAIAILDQDLPLRSGMDCLIAMRLKNPKLPAIIITGQPDFGLDESFADVTVLHKPFKPSALHRLVYERLRIKDLSHSSS
jgi:signal transduction histidine kinase/ligand-binding sensor domain-containing protein/CheY-like chemotaxis protein